MCVCAEEAGQNGTMRHVARIFNDDVGARSRPPPALLRAPPTPLRRARAGVELVERTGKNPQNIYLQLGCSKHAEQKMLSFVQHHCVGKPFSNLAMFLSLLWPRETDCQSFFCAGARTPEWSHVALLSHLPRTVRAELVAAILKEGGLMDAYSNPGSATPEMLHRIYASRAAVAGNPCVLRDVQASSLHFNSTIGTSAYPGMSERAAEYEHHLTQRAVLAHAAVAPPPIAPPSSLSTGRRRAASPTRGHFRDVGRNQYGGGGSGCCVARAPPSQPGVQLTLNSLDFSSSARMRR